jgi:phage I-like protein
MPAPLELLTLRANAPQFDPAQGEKGLPQKILVLAWGGHDTTKGKVICNETTLRQLAAYNAAQNWDRIALDFEHNSVPGSPTYAGEPVKISGYGTLQLVAGEGIYLLMTSWTPEGREYAAGGHYGDLSPVVKVNEKNEVIGLHSVALCRHGATPGLVFLSTALAAHTGAHDPSRTTRLSTTAMKPEELVLKLAEMLGLAATATPDEVLAALTAKMGETEKELTAMKEKEKALSAQAGQSDELKALSSQLTEMREQLKTLSTTQLDSQRGEIIAQATREGKAVPSIAKTMNLADLKQLCAELPVTIPLEKRTPGLVILSGGAGHEAPEAKAVSEMTGVSDEDRKKYAHR